MTNKKKFLLLIIMAPIMVVVLVLFELHQHTSKETKAAFARMEKEARYLSRDWIKNDFVPVGTESCSNFLHTVVNNATGRYSNKTQEQLLQNALQHFFSAYSVGTYEAYKQFRTPEGVPFKWKTNHWGSLDDHIKEYGLSKVRNRPPEEKLAAYIKQHAVGQVFSNYFAGVGSNDARIVVQSFADNVPAAWETHFYPSNFSTLSTNVPRYGTVLSATPYFPNAGFLSLKTDYTFIEFEDSLEKILERSGAVTVADCFFFIKRNSQFFNPVLPVIVRFYWSERAQRWLPDDLVQCSMAKDVLVVF